MDLISTVLGIFSWAVANTDLRLTLDLNSVFIRVDFPRPLCPVSKHTLWVTQTARIGYKPEIVTSE